MGKAVAISCPECKRVFNLKSNLTRHLRMVHNKQIERIDIQPAEFDVYHYKCVEGCGISFRYNRDLRAHLERGHQMAMTELNLEFPNFDEFNKWRYKEENDNYIQYVHLTATKRRSMGTETYYYECSRTGKRQLIDETSRKRKQRRTGTAKLNHGCTSQIIANKSPDGSLTVIYYKTHYGHETEIGHIKLSKTDRAAIASKMLLGVPISSLLHAAKTTTGTSIKRINMLRRKDVDNIKKSFNITVKDGRLADADTINIRNFFAECSEQEHNPIMFYSFGDTPESDKISFAIMTKYQSEMLSENGNNNIILIKTTNLHNCDFFLTTLFVIGSSGDSFPAASMFSTVNNYATIQLFFTKIHEFVGRISPNVFVSDPGDFYYAAWQSTMGNATYTLYNEIEVEIDWRTNLNRICCAENDVTKVKRAWVYDTLKILQGIGEESEFRENLDETLRLFNDDPDFKDFEDFFIGRYSDVQKWAGTYRTQCLATLRDVTVVSDVLKHYLNEGNEVRLNRIFQSLIRFIRDETVNSMLKTKETRASFIVANDARHRALSERSFNGNRIADDLWHVTDEATGASHVLQRYLEEKCCNLTCSFCQICIHCFSCTCVDFFLSNSICDHIHFVWVTYFQVIKSGSEGGGESDEVYYDEEIIIEMNDDEEVQDDSADLREQINGKCVELSNSLSGLGSDSLKIVLQAMKELCELGESGKKDVLSDHTYL